MKRLKILEFPDKRLRRVSEAITTFDPGLKRLSDNMLMTMYEEKGIGLAAPQVNKPVRLIVMDISEDRDQPLVFVNPVVSSFEGKVESNEGCLSVPDIKTDIKRHETITLNAQNLKGTAISFEADGLLSICIQHEIDHLNGKLFIDYISDIKLQRLRKKVAKQNKAARIERQKNTRLI
jgi:peptide deformylase